jgi:outer membrane receptor protein involved in Fe transport
MEITLRVITHLPVICLSLLFYTTLGFATEPTTPSDIKSATQLQNEIDKLQQQLETAQQTIAAQQVELASLKQEKEAVSTTNLAANSQNNNTGSHTNPLTEITRYSKDGLTLPANPVRPESITRITQEQINLGSVEDISRLEYLAPGLRYGQTGHDARLSMRGARTNSIGPEANSVVGMFEDGVYIPTSTERTDNFLDVEYIDVLRGPQVTNFGHQAYAGAISVVTRKPNFDGFDGYAIAENGLPDKTRWQLAVNIPISDTLAIRVAGLSETRSGWINNYELESDSDDLGEKKVQTMRLSLLWQPSDDFSLLVWSRHQDENGAGTGPWGYQQIGGYVDGSLQPGHQFAPDGYRPDHDAWNIFRNFDYGISYEHWVNTAELNWNMGFADLKWLSNFTSFHGRQVYDNDYTDQGEFINSAFAGWSNSQTSWSSELRLTSKSSGRLNWLAGLYFFNRSTDWGWLEVDNGELFQPAWDEPGTYSTDTLAAFAQANYSISDKLQLTGGLRWNEENKTSKTGEQGSWDDVLWKAALEYRFTDTMMAYTSISTGYQPGGMNYAPGVNARWEPETLTAYEVGLKSSFFDDRLNLDLAFWYNDFSNVQSQSFLSLPFPGSPEATEYTGNGGASSATGVEAEIRWLPMPQWNVSGFASYSDAKFGDFYNKSYSGLGEIPGHTEGNNINYNGWQPALTPDLVVGIQTFYDFNLKEWGILTPYLQTTYSSDYYANDLNLAGVKQTAYTRVDFRVIWQTPVDNFRLQFYYLNGGDEQVLNWARVYNPAARPDITTLQANWGQPNAYGVIFDYAF